jgi:hypothetical protein
MKKLFVIQKFIWATGVKDALKLEHAQPADAVYLDEDWRKNNTQKV